MAQMTVQIVTPDGLVFDHHATERPLLGNERIWRY